MKILVTGGAGFIGAHLIRRLVSQGHQVEALVRHVREVELLENLDVRFHPADITAPDSLDRIEGSWDAVINATGRMGKFSVTGEALRAVNVTGVENLYRWARGRGVPHFIHLSTVGVAGPVDGSPSPETSAPVLRDENSPCHPSTEYERSKLDGEQALRRWYQEGSPAVTLVRVGFTFGPGDRHKLALFRAVSRGYFFFPGPGTGQLQPIYVEDLVHAIEKILIRSPAGVEVFHLCGPRPLTWNAFIQMICEELGRHRLPPHVPEPLVRAGATVAESLGRVFGFPPPLTHSRISLMTRSYTFSAEKVESMLDYRPETGLREGIARTIRWYRGRHWL